VNRRVLGALGGLVLVAGLAVYATTGYVRVRQLRLEIDAMEKEMTALREQAATLATTIDRLRHDPDYLEKIAREEHGLARPGETILKFPSSRSR
jgi:cell division protein FtsB